MNFTLRFSRINLVSVPDLTLDELWHVMDVTSDRLITLFDLSTLNDREETRSQRALAYRFNRRERERESTV